ncbi:MAG: hypothetical protein WD065_09990 [Planctomycetaceae bacterium]
MSEHRRFQKMKIPSALTLLVLTLFLWIWTLRIYSRELPTLGCRVRVPFVIMQLAARDDGVHFLAMQNRAAQFPEVSFRKHNHFGSAGYHYGIVGNVLGIVVAVLTTRVIDYDYFVSPYAALVLPYWLLFIVSSGVLIAHAPIRRRLAPVCRLSFASGFAGTIVLVLLAFANFVPGVSMAKPNVQPQSLSEWVRLTMTPKDIYSEARFDYGYPFVYLYDGVVNGKSVSNFHGTTVGCKQHKVGENATIALLLAFVAVVMTNVGIGGWVRGFASSQALSQKNVHV